MMNEILLKANLNKIPTQLYTKSVYYVKVNLFMMHEISNVAQKIQNARMNNKIENFDEDFYLDVSSIFKYKIFKYDADDEETQLKFREYHFNIPYFFYYLIAKPNLFFSFLKNNNFKFEHVISFINIYLIFIIREYKKKFKFIDE